MSHTVDATEPQPSRHTRRKAQTHARITAAAHALFAEKGYLHTSMEDISQASDVAVRTIYTHFPSKAAILLDYFDRWLDALVDGILERPVDEPIAEAVAASLDAMTDAGWIDRDYSDLTGSPPSALGLTSGPPEVAGYMMHAWMQAQQRIVADAIDRGHTDDDPLAAVARGAAVFAICLGPMVAANLARHGGPALPPDASANSLLGEIATRLTDGTT